MSEQRTGDAEKRVKVHQESPVPIAYLAPEGPVLATFSDNLLVSASSGAVTFTFWQIIAPTSLEQREQAQAVMVGKFVVTAKKAKEISETLSNLLAQIGEPEGK